MSTNQVLYIGQEKQEELFEAIFSRYPNRIGKKKAWSHFRATVKADEDWVNINKALDNYINSREVKDKFIKNAKTWFNEWSDWLNHQCDVKQEQPRKQDDRGEKAREKLEAERAEEKEKFKGQETPDSIRLPGINLNKPGTCKEGEA